MWTYVIQLLSAVVSAAHVFFRCWLAVSCVCEFLYYKLWEKRVAWAVERRERKTLRQVTVLFKVNSILTHSQKRRKSISVIARLLIESKIPFGYFFVGSEKKRWRRNLSLSRSFARSIVSQPWKCKVQTLRVHEK